MNCETCRGLLVDRLSGALAGETARSIEDHLATCAACRAEAAELDAAWQALGALPAEEAPPVMRERFDLFLAAAQAEARRARPTLAERLAFLWPRQPALQAALVALALLGGYALGTGGRGGEHREVAELRQEVRSLHHVVALSLLERDSASERLRGVSLTESADTGDPAVLAALLDAVRADPSVNVRLAAIDALAPRAGGAPVRSQLLAAFAAESSPMVQVAIADAVLAADGAQARRELAQSIGDPRLDPKVKDYLARRLREEA
jgi:predicted anti-sigma-YlaC factor YlaD